MTSKEALEEIINDYHKSVIKYYYNSNISKEYRDELFDKYKDKFEVIKKDLEALETIKENCGLVYEDGNTYFKVNIKEYDYLRRPIEDFDKVKHLAERN